MKATFLASISFLTHSINIIPEMKMLGFYELMDAGMFDEEFKSQYGALFQFNSFNRYAWVIKEVELKETDNVNDVIINNMALMRFDITTYFNFSWFVKDNNVSLYNQYAFIKGRKESYIHSSDRPDYCADGGLYDAEFTGTEVERINDIYAKYLQKSSNHRISLDTVKKLREHGEKTTKQIATSGLINTVHYDDFTSIERAIMFLGEARSVEFLPRRISIYMQLLEALFATESEGVNFKVPLRVANYITTESNVKKDIFDKITEAYNIRSRYLHGDRLNKGNKKKLKMEDLIPISVEIDSIIRSVLTKIIKEDVDNFLLPTDDEKNKDGEVIKKGLRSYLNALVFA